MADDQLPPAGSGAQDPTPLPPPAGVAAPPPTAVAGADASISKDDRTMAMLAHLLGIVTSIIGPLIIWLIKKDQSAFVDEHGKEALNFQITMLIGQVIGMVTAAFCIGVVIMPLVMLATVIFSILAAIKTNAGVHYRYPFAIRMVK